MLLSEVLSGTGATLRNDAQVSGLCYDSRKLQPGDAFFCVPGLVADGHDFAQRAADAGAGALIVERPLPIDLPQAVVDSVRTAMSVAAANFYGRPADQLVMVAVGGTKGKTSTAHMIKCACEACGMKVGLIGSLGRMIGDKLDSADLNTPEAIDLHRLLRQMVDEGVQLCVMETSAHGLDQHRLDGVTYEVAVMTNFTQDHLDYFGDMDTYALAKKRLFSKELCRHAVINLDADRALWFVDGFGGPVTTYAISHPSDAHANDIELDENGLSFRMTLGEHDLPVRMQVSALFNVYNTLAAATACWVLGLPLEQVIHGIADLQVVPGRMERLRTGTPYSVVLDYAHSPDSLQNILTAVRSFAKGRVIALFGCGGMRDNRKRPIMGKIAGDIADYVILTSDNPRFEEPMEIITQIEGGLAPTGTPYEIIESRREAIRRALAIAQPGDVVLLAGKGHETYQERLGVKHPFDERVVVQEILRETGAVMP